MIKPRPPNSHVTIDVQVDQQLMLEALHASVPIVTRHAVARAALEAGLAVLRDDPAKLHGLLAAQRGRRASNAAIAIATTTVLKKEVTP